jgi:hypothetical protein
MPAMFAIDEARIVFIMNWEVWEDLMFSIDWIWVLPLLKSWDSEELEVDIVVRLLDKLESVYLKLVDCDYEVFQ